VLRASMLETSTDVRLVLADVRIPTFEVEASMIHPQRVLGEPNRLRIDARNLSGEPTPVERLRWSMECRESWPMREPQGWSLHARIDAPPLSREGELEVTPATAHAEVELDTAALAPSIAHHCSVSVAAQDVSLQEVGAEASFVVHPGPVYIGLRTPDAPVAKRPLAVEVQALDLEQRRVGLSDVEVQIHRLPERFAEWRDRGQPESERELVARCRLTLAADGDHSRCAVRRPRAGVYAIQATAIHEGFELRTDTVMEVVAAPRKRARAPVDAHEASDTAAPEPEPERPLAERRPREFRIEAPRELPAGRPAKIVVEAPWAAGKGLLSVAQTGLRDAKPFELRDGRATITVTPRAGQGPALELRATMVRPSEDGGLPRLHVARHDLSVRSMRELVVRIEAPATGRPGERVPVRLVVRDPVRDEPVDARLAVWVIDDGVHQLRPTYWRDLVAVFDPARPGLVTLTNGFEALLAPFSPWSARRSARKPAVRSAAGKVLGGLDAVHSRFEPEPLFVGDVGTGPDGEAEVVLPLPHDLTRFRITAIASAELPEGGSGPARFGRQEATVQVSAPLMVRLALPRVLRPGDEAELAALVTPPKGAEGTLEVELALEDATGRLSLRGPSRAVRAVHGREPIRVPFRVRAEGPGRPQVRVHARLRPSASETPREGEPRARAAAPTSPDRRPRPRTARPLDTTVLRPLVVELERTAIERTAIHGRLDRDQPVAIPVLVPHGARPDHGGLSLSVRGTAIGDLDEAARYLEEYPYGCVEQTASRLLPQLALQGLADRLPPGSDPAARVADGLAHLVTMQHDDGTFGYWPGDPEVAAHAGAYATWVMQLAADAGQPVPAKALAKALDALAAGLAAPLPAGSHARDLRRAELALEVHVLARAGRAGDPAVQAVLDDLHAHRDALPLFARAWLLMALHAVDPRDSRIGDVRRGISAAIERQAGFAQPVDTASDRYGALFDSDARTHALVLMAWLRLDPDDPVVDELAHGLRLRRSGGRWRNTQENAYALLALSAYAREREAVVPDHRIDAWVGPRRLAPLEQHDRDPTPRERTVPMAELLGPLGTDRTATVVLDREGEGAAYWRLGMEWSVAGPAPARSQGLSLSRRLLDAEGQPVDPGSLRAGRRYLLEVVLDADVPMPYVAVELPLPAGLEAIDASLGAGGRARAPELALAGWVDHQELHRDRVLVFADELGTGPHVHTIPVLATTPGRYVLPAAVAEAMYAPEIRARTTTTRVRVGPSR
jgi:alpha-2-macroglobulin